MSSAQPTIQPSLTERVLRSHHGPLTEQLIQTPGEFGLGRVPARLKPDATTTVVCGFCSTGCGLNAHLRAGEAINLTAATDYPVNLGMACPKGWEALAPLSAPDRATVPLLRDSGGRLRPTTWHDAMSLFATKFRAIQARHGPDSLAWLGTGQICTEEMALLGALAKFGIGILHGDGNTRQCMSTSAVAYKQSFGFDAPPFTYADFEESDVIVLIGSNLCIAHPILWQRVLRNRRRPEIIVVDPRRTETAMNATQHYAIRPKSDLTLLYGLANVLLENGWVDGDFVESHTVGFTGFLGLAQQFTLQRVCAATGLQPDQLKRFAETIHRGGAVSFWWTMGVNQGHEATRTAQAIINLALMTGNIGRPGTGANSITGQCNAMGSRLFSNTTNLLGGHDFTNPADRRKIAGILGIPAVRIPEQNSWAYDQIVDGIREGRIKGLWLVATNPSHSWIHQGAFNDLIRNLEFLVVQDMFYSTETAQLAHLVLPAAGWGEKEGTFINSERRIGLTKKVARAPGQALSDFHIFRLAADYFGCDELFRDWTSPEAVFEILKRCSAGQPCDITGIRDYRMIDECGGIQWPCVQGSPQFPGSDCESGPTIPVHDRAPEIPEIRPATERRLFEDGRFFTPDARARFLFDNPQPVPRPADGEYPFVLLTGRGTSAQWHTLTRTNKSAILRQLSPERLYVEIHPEDAARLTIDAGDPVQIRSRQGVLVATAYVTATVQPGQVFLPMHFPTTNLLTDPVFDPHSRQPSYKYCAVQLELVRKQPTRSKRPNPKSATRAKPAA